MARISTSASPVKRGRGRPPKNAKRNIPDPSAVPSTPTKKSLPGRPKKSTAIEDIAAEEGLGPVVSPRKSRDADKPTLPSDVAPPAAPAARTSPRSKATAQKGEQTSGNGAAGASEYRGRGRPRKSDGKTATKSATKTENPTINRVKSGRVGRPRKNATSVVPEAAIRGRPRKAAATNARTIATGSKAKTTTRDRIGRTSKDASASESVDAMLEDVKAEFGRLKERTEELLTAVKRNTVDRAKFDKLVAANASMQAELLELRGTVGDLGVDAAAVEQRLDHVEEFLATEMNMEVDDEAVGTNGNGVTDGDDADDDAENDAVIAEIAASADAPHRPIPTLVINGALLDGGEDIEIDVVPNVQVVATQEGGSSTQFPTFSTAREQDEALLDEDFIDDGDEEEEQVQINGDGDEEDGPLGPANPKAQSIFGSVFSAVRERLSSPGRGASPGRMMSPGR